MDAEYQEWVHAPSHLFKPNSFYFVTAATYQKTMLFNSAEKLDFLLRSLFEEAQSWGWRLEAWALFANHYHFIGLAPENAKTLKAMLGSLHSKTAIWLNRIDNTPGRRVWYQYRDTCLTYERSYMARLNYVVNNPLKHRVTQNAENYRWCSMAWFMKTAKAGHRRTVLSFPHDRLEIEDDF